ncbi:MAG TPA: dTDP-4-dehydrorhamnose 3,5-epimerase [Clostridia bacterium]|nr:dTDP-4-dehydrorhamnose 3,5-epimerase [Clostridia bacterium]
MKLIKTQLDGLFIVEPQVFGDNRGWFYESYSHEKFKELGLDTVFVQDNRSFSCCKGTIRGLHCQKEPKAQAKLLSCTRGAIYDVAVDIRQGSPTYLKWIGIELNSANKSMIYIPKGFLHGFLTLTDDVEVYYKVDEYYSSDNDRSIRFDDNQIGVDWGISEPIISSKDLNAPSLSESDVKFIY